MTLILTAKRRHFLQCSFSLFLTVRCWMAGWCLCEWVHNPKGKQREASTSSGPMVYWVSGSDHDRRVTWVSLHCWGHNSVAITPKGRWGMRIWDGAFAANDHQRTNKGVVLVIHTATELLLVNQSRSNWTCSASNSRCSLSSRSSSWRIPQCIRCQKSASRAAWELFYSWSW